ncbi:hypothetical protein TYRP_012943 [Tyrophagus putrescentiae]|nr:hypothetical protein TYRP_012943 [Tyrophagus putrescentiae]
MKKLIEVPFNNSSANNELNKQTYLSLDGVMANRNRFTFHSVHQLSARYLQYIRAYLWKEWAVYLYICIVFATNLRLLFSTQMIYSSGCINFEADDLSSCAKTPQKVQNEMLIKDNFIYVYYCFVIYFILPLLYTAVSMYQEINVFRNEHRNGWYSAGAHFLMKIPFEMTPLVISNVVFVLAIIALSGTYVFTMVIGGAFVPFDEMPYIYKLLATFSIPRYTFQSAILLLFGFGRCQGQYVSSVLYSMNINDADYLSHIFMLLLNILIYRSLALYILIRCANPDENCKKRDA